MLTGPGAVLVSENTDWDDVGDDIVMIDYDEDPDRVEVLASFSFGSGASFTCEYDTLACE